MFQLRALIPCLLCCAALTAAPVDYEAPLEPNLVPYEDLNNHPEQHLGETIHFAFNLESQLETWNPFLTRFGPTQFTCLRGWSDESFPWVRWHYDNPSIRLYLPSGSPAERLARTASPYARFAVVGVVRELFAGQPWIEVLSIERLEAALNEGTVLHAERGMREMRAEQYTLAIENLERARIGTLPATTARELDRLLAECRAGLAAAGE